MFAQTAVELLQVEGVFLEQRHKATLAGIHPIRQVINMSSYYRAQYPYKQNAACVELVQSQAPQEWEEDELLQGVIPKHISYFQNLSMVCHKSAQQSLASIQLPKDLHH